MCPLYMYDGKHSAELELTFLQPQEVIKSILILLIKYWKLQHALVQSKFILSWTRFHWNAQGKLGAL